MYFTLVILQINAVDISKDLIKNIAFINYQEKIHKCTQLSPPFIDFWVKRRWLQISMHSMSYSPCTTKSTCMHA